MIDLHCHILPGVDDGPHSPEESLEMARIAVKDGIRAIVATPHTLNGLYTNHLEEVIKRVHFLQSSFYENNIDLSLYVGADVHLCPHLVDKISSGEAPTVNDGRKFILLELPAMTFPRKEVKDEIFHLKLNGITPIITHPERNAIIQQDPETLYEFIQMGALSQITAMSITGEFGIDVKHSSETLLRHRLGHIIASDAHSAGSRPPVLSRAVEHATQILGDKEEAERMVTEAPRAVVSGKMPDIPEPSHVKGRK